MKWNWAVMFVGDDGEEGTCFFCGTRSEVTAFAKEMEEDGYGYIEIWQLDAEEV